MEMNIRSGTTVAELVDVWLRKLRVSGHLENTTVNEYERVLRKLVLPELGTVRLNELTTERINAVLAKLGTRSVNRQRKSKVVTGAMLDLAVECGALSSNPARGSISVSRPATQTRTLTRSDLETARKAVRAWASKKRSGPKSTGDMADIIDLMLLPESASGKCWRSDGATSTLTRSESRSERRSRPKPVWVLTERLWQMRGSSSSQTSRSRSSADASPSRETATPRPCSQPGTERGSRSTTSSDAGARSGRTLAWIG
jgi:hypothetical protein